MVATFIELANQNEERMDGTVAPVREIIGGSDIVIGIWPDATRSDGVDYSLILVRGGCSSRRMSGSLLPA
jgi:hypothetical protein